MEGIIPGDAQGIGSLASSASRILLTEGENKIKKIKLSQGKITLVDNSDFEYLSKFKWHAHERHGHWYALRTGIKGKVIRMHRVIIKANQNKMVDHINGDGLDNRRKNLRIATQSENARNAIKRNIGSSKYKGVGWHKASNKWCAKISFNKKDIWLGLFHSENKAAQAYNQAARKFHKNFAKENTLE
jgi:hypothetical protein